MERASYFRFIQKELFSFPSIGLDISDASFHVVQTKRHSSGLYSVERASKSSLPSGLVDLGEIKQEKKLSELLQNHLKENGFRSDHMIIASLPEEKAFIKMLQIPYIEDPEELRSAIQFEAETNIPIPAAEMYFDYEDVLLPTKQYNHRDVVVIAYPKNLVDSYVRAIAGAGLELGALELESQSIIRCLLDLSRAQQPLLVIDIGRTKSGFIIFGDMTIAFTSTLPIGGRDFEKALEEHLGIDASTAEKLKKEHGMALAGGDTRDILQSFVSVIIDEAKKNIEFYETHPRHTHTDHRSIGKIILCGGDSYLLGLSDELAIRTNLSVEYGNPLRAFKKAAHSESHLTEHDALSFTTALGLAMRTSL